MKDLSNMPDMKMVLEDGRSHKLTKARVNAVISRELCRVDDVRLYGINVTLEYDKDDVPEGIIEYLTSHIRWKPVGDGIVRVYVEYNGNRVPVDIHGGNVDECWHGFINTTIWE